jgi:hypothetical protein
MITGGAGGSLPLPQTPSEWLALGLALLVVVWVVKAWLDDD